MSLGWGGCRGGGDVWLCNVKGKEGAGEETWRVIVESTLLMDVVVMLIFDGLAEGRKAWVE